MATQTDTDNIWHTLGRLEEDQRRTEVAIRDLQEGLRDVNRRIDRLFYAIIGVGGAIVVAVVVSNYLGS